MEVLIVGTGAIGVAMAATLHSVGWGVSLLSRGATKDAIAAGGLRRTGLFGEAAIPAGEATVSDDYGAFPENAFDYILISVKTMANDAVSDALWENRAILKPQGKMVILQNGWGNDQAYLRHFPKEQVCCARVITGFQRQAPNVSNVTVHTAPVLLGNLYGLD
ncbi:MAG: ketopantoate reductase family protein, partial [Clostridiales bacterium]|nr:ketopantoate reductase family protein [Clostridiales bacterium]